MLTRNDLRTVLIEAFAGAADGLRAGRDLDARKAQPSDPQSTGQPGTINNKLVLTVAEAAETLGIGRSAAYELVRTGQLRSVQLGRRRLIPAQAVLELIGRPPSQ